MTDIQFLRKLVIVLADSGKDYSLALEVLRIKEMAAAKERDESKELEAA